MGTVIDAHEEQEILESRLITEIYEERGRIKNGKLVHFPKCQAKCQPGVVERFEKESKVAVNKAEQYEAASE